MSRSILGNCTHRQTELSYIHERDSPVKDRVAEGAHSAGVGTAKESVVNKVAEGLRFGCGRECQRGASASTADRDSDDLAVIVTGLNCAFEIAVLVPDAAVLSN